MLGVYTVCLVRAVPDRRRPARLRRRRQPGSRPALRHQERPGADERLHHRRCHRRASRAWAALGRIPNADPNAYQNANLETITAVVIGGTSLFGGRGRVLGTLVGTLIVGVLRNGLTQAGVDSLYQNIATGILVILAVALDQFARRRSSDRPRSGGPWSGQDATAA